MALKNDLSRIVALAYAQAQPLAGLTRYRDQVFDRGSEATLVVAGLLLGYATRLGLADLAAKVDISINELRRGRLIRRAQLIRQVYEARGRESGKIL